MGGAGSGHLTRLLKVLAGLPSSVWRWKSSLQGGLSSFRQETSAPCRVGLSIQPGTAWLHPEQGEGGRPPCLYKPPSPTLSFLPILFYLLEASCSPTHTQLEADMQGPEYQEAGVPGAILKVGCCGIDS